MPLLQGAGRTLELQDCRRQHPKATASACSAERWRNAAGGSGCWLLKRRKRHQRGGRRRSRLIARRVALHQLTTQAARSVRWKRLRLPRARSRPPCAGLGAPCARLLNASSDQQYRHNAASGLQEMRAAAGTTFCCRGADADAGVTLRRSAHFWPHALVLLRRTSIQNYASIHQECSQLILSMERPCDCSSKRGSCSAQQHCLKTACGDYYRVCTGRRTQQAEW